MTEPLVNYDTRNPNEEMPLVCMSVRGTLRDDLADVEVEQIWRNAENTNIEGVFTFPLPVDGVLLALTVELNGRTLNANVTRRQQAETEYEEAVAEGNTAVLLSQLEEGLYSINVGNLMPQDEAKVRVRYMLPLSWERNELRLALPTTVAPRYGDPAQAGIARWAAPLTDVTAEHRYSLDLTIAGDLATLPVASPSHAIAVRSAQDGLHVAFAQGETFADRDLVLTLRSAQALPSTQRLFKDGEQNIMHAVFRVPPPSERRPVALKVLVDCSGSMAGDSIAIARDAAKLAIGSLKDGDVFSVSAFGTHVKLEPVGGRSLATAGLSYRIRHAMQFIESLDADLGGTELQGALAAVFAIGGAWSGGSAVEGGDVLLITDGETWNYHEVLEAARSTGHRLFVIGIGSAPNTRLVRDMARATGGAAAYVGPGEPVDPVVERMLARMSAPKVVDAALSLPGYELWRSPEQLDAGIYPDATLHVVAALHSEGVAHNTAATLQLRFADGTSTSICAMPQAAVAAAEQHAVLSARDVARIGISQRIREQMFRSEGVDEGALADLAVEYQVLCDFTACVLVEKRTDESTDQLPELRQVPQMLAAGWGGVGSTICFSKSSDVSASGMGPLAYGSMDPPAVWKAPAASDIQASIDDSAAEQIARRSFEDHSVEPIQDWIDEYRSVPAFLRKGVNPPERTPAQVIESLQSSDMAVVGLATVQLTFAGLRALGIPQALIYELSALVTDTCPEHEVAAAFWDALMHSAVGHLFDRMARRMVIRSLAGQSTTAVLKLRLTQLLDGIAVDVWPARDEVIAVARTG